MLEINALFEPDAEAGGFVVTFPDFPWGVTQGETEAEATEMAEDAIAMVINELIKRGQEIPQRSKVRGRKYRTIHLPAMQAAKVELYRQFRTSGLRKVDLARRIGIPKGHRKNNFTDSVESCSSIAGVPCLG